MTLQHAPGSTVVELAAPSPVVRSLPSEGVVGLVVRASGNDGPTTKPALTLVETLADALEYIGDVSTDDPNEAGPTLQRLYARGRSTGRTRVLLSVYDENETGADLIAAINDRFDALLRASTPRPNIIYAPGLGHAGDTTPTVEKAPYLDKLIATALGVRGIGVVDVPPPAAAASNDLTIDEITGATTSWIANNNSGRLFGVDIWQGTRANPIPGGGNAIGALLSLEDEPGKGWWTNPFAHNIYGVSTQLRAKSFSEDYNVASDVGKEANVGIVSAVRSPVGEGDEFWGGRLLLQATDTTTSPSTIRDLRINDHLYLAATHRAGQVLRGMQGLGSNALPYAVGQYNGLMQNFQDEGVIRGFTVSIAQVSPPRLRVLYTPLDSYDRLPIEFGLDPAATG